MGKLTLVRYGKPSQFDEAPYGSKCMVNYHQQESYEIYIQTSKDPEHPAWDYIGEFNRLSSEEHIEQLISRRLGL